MNLTLGLLSSLLSLALHGVILMTWQSSEAFNPTFKTSVSSISVVLKSVKPESEGISPSHSQSSIAESGVIEESMPELMSPIEPEYPWRSRMMKEEGEVSARFKLNQAGRAYDIKISKSSGYTRLDESALAAIAQAQYDVSKAEAKDLEITLNFKLKDK
ncbi:MAG: hypothetical protein CME71_03360 [Halobacteriovorax sp.]|nr:hypothetical protein [Halobacteriovorax sp.]|tara:strand:+ start:159 stop:635 length:477 start_codon:yes stop_codon:yes gene_type:complete